MTATVPAIDIQQVSKRFGGFQALTDVNFSIPSGSVFGLLGPNGAGKTTLMSIISGFLKPSRGQIKVLGIDIENVSELRGRLSILPQDAQLMANMPVVQQLVFFSQLNGNDRASAEAEAKRALEKVRLSERASEDARVLSHGMSKRLGIAQAFLGNPEVILLDEPTAGLDPKSAADVRDLVDELKERATVIVSSHNMADIQKMCDAVAILDHGRLITHSRVSELTHSGSIIRMRFVRDLTADEIAAASANESVSKVEAQGDFVYSIHVAPDALKNQQDALIADIVGRLLPTAAVPRAIETGVGLEERFLEVTRAAQPTPG